MRGRGGNRGDLGLPLSPSNTPTTLPLSLVSTHAIPLNLPSISCNPPPRSPLDISPPMPSGQSQPCLFVTNIGVRPAEPCSLSVAATHHLLTCLLVCLMQSVSDQKLSQFVGSKYKQADVRQLETNATLCVQALEDITGTTAELVPKDSATAKELRAQGATWADHVLELPLAWLLSAAYIVATVVSGYALFGGIAAAAGLASDSPLIYALRFLDAAVYVLLPQWTVLLIRAVQRRSLGHRLATRTLVIGDVPWVAQCADAFLSKLFAVTYNVTAITVFSGNPADHLVHRFTHRVYRGVLLACGRPDGRLSALTAAENSVCLAVNQAASIRFVQTTCEAVTLGHNPSPLSLAKHSVFLPGGRKQYLCERLLKEREPGLKECSSGALAEKYAHLMTSTMSDACRASASNQDLFGGVSLTSPTFQQWDQTEATVCEYYGQVLRKDNRHVRYGCGQGMEGLGEQGGP